MSSVGRWYGNQWFACHDDNMSMECEDDIAGALMAHGSTFCGRRLLFWGASHAEGATLYRTDVFRCLLRGVVVTVS